MTPAEKERVTRREDRLRAQIATLKDRLIVARGKGKAKSASARSRGGGARPAAAKGRSRAPARSARSKTTEAAV